MNENEIDRIACAVNALRPDWPVASLRTLLTKPELAHKARRDVAVALAWVACESKTKTPARVLEAGPWWAATNTEGSPSLRNPTPAEACATCGRRETEHASRWVGDHPFRPLAPRHYTADDVRNGVMGDQNRSAAEGVRQAIVEARAALCPCGTPRSHCKDHREDESAQEGER